MALAWAQSQCSESSSATAALLMTQTPPPGQREEFELPPGYLVIFTQILPDGLGDLIFGENAVRELQEIGPIVWFRCYTGEENAPAGERLIADTAKSLAFSVSCTGKEPLESKLSAVNIEKIWLGARERFLAPWIFGLSTHEQVLLSLSERTQKRFWALTEYGRGMGNIHTYTGGLGVMIPTGWIVEGESGGVFRSVLKQPRTDTDWRKIFAEHCGLSSPAKIRLWWFYSRKDDEKKHGFRELPKEEGLPQHVRVVSKLIPAGSDGQIALGQEKTSGEKLAEQLFQAANDPSFKPNTDVATAEVASGTAAQLSQFLWGLVTDRNFTLPMMGNSRAGPSIPNEEAIDIIVTPNIFTKWREEDGGVRTVAKVAQLDLVDRAGRRKEMRLDGRQIYICSARVPRHEMRTFLEACEERVHTTGDQSLAEAMFLDKIPCIRPDAKVQQWQYALLAKATNAMDKVPDLGAILRSLVEDESVRQAAVAASKQKSDELERQMVAQLGSGPEMWTPTQQVLARAGMMG